VSSTDGQLYAVRIACDATFAPLVEAGLDLLGRQMVTWEHDDTGRVTFEEYLPEQAAADQCALELRRHLDRWSAGDAWGVDVRPLPARGWQERWKEHFHAERVSHRVVVKPSWEAWEAAAGDVVVELDPGMSFGTGLHPTTRACLQFLDRVSDERPGCSFLDLGCGSGILTIAAVKLGYGRVTAVDHDPGAVGTTVRNLEHNAAGGRAACAVADLADWRDDRAYDVVAANLLAGILTRHAARILDAVQTTPPGDLFLAGILEGQYKDIRTLYESSGANEVSRTTQDGWTSGRFRRVVQAGTD